MNTYSIYIRPQALRELKNMPGHMRQRIRRATDGLAKNPLPPGSVELSNVSSNRPGLRLFRLRLEKWRILYTIDEEDYAIDVLAVRQRPPYDYGDLSELLNQLR